MSSRRFYVQFGTELNFVEESNQLMSISVGLSKKRFTSSHLQTVDILAGLHMRCRAKDHKCSHTKYRNLVKYI